MKLSLFQKKSTLIINTIKSIRSELASAKCLSLNYVWKLQIKILRRKKLESYLKYLETIKHIDKANVTISNLFEKTDFKKIRNILMVLNSGLNNRFK